MSITYTSLLGLAQPTPGTESGTWGTTINDSVTALLETAIAGSKTADVTSSNWTLTDIDGADDTARAAVLIPTGTNGATTRSILAPNQSKVFVIINQATGSVVIKGVTGPTTGVTIPTGKTTLVAWNGTDFVEISPSTASTTTNLAGGGAGSIPYQSALGTTAFLSAGTSGQLVTSGGAGALTWSTPGTSPKTISNKTGAYTVVAGDSGTIINCTSNTFTVSLTAAATIGTGFTCTIWNTSSTATDVITIDPAGTETIDGSATWRLFPGEGTDIVCNGTNWISGAGKNLQYFAECALPGGYINDIQAGADGAIAIAPRATALAVRSLAIGYTAAAGAVNSSAIGVNSVNAGSVTATGSGAMALGGSYASGVDSFAAAIGNNTSSYGATGANSVAIGYLTKASGQYTFAGGYNSIAAQIGKYAYSSGAFATQGDAQYGVIVLRAVASATAVALTTDGAAASTNNQLIIATGQSMAIQGTLIAKGPSSGGIAAYTITGAVSNNSGTLSSTGLALTLIGTNTIGLNAPTIAVDTTNKAVKILSGTYGSSVRYVATINTSEVTYA